MTNKRHWLTYSAALLIPAFLIVFAPSAQAQGYNGPSLLSRGGNRPGHRGKAPVEFTYYGGIRGTYETGLLPPSAFTAPAPGESRQNAPTVDVAGVQAEVGLYGGHSWRHSSLGVDYRGDWRQSNKNVYRGLNGSNQSLALQYEAQPTAHTVFTVSEVAGTTNRAFGGFTAPAFSEVNRPGVPLNEFYDSRVYYTQTLGSFSYLKSARLSITGNGGLFSVRRTNLGLQSMNGAQGGTQALYRFTRTDTAGPIYEYLHFSYPRAFGQSHIHTVGGQYSKKFSRNWDMTVIGGIIRASTTGTQSITLSPEIALILGRSTGFEAYRRTGYHPRLEAEANYTLQRSKLNLHASQGINPGNGVYQTTLQRTATAGYSYSGIRKWTFGLSVGYSRHQSVSQVIPGFTSVQGGGGMQYRLAQHVELSGQLDYRTFNSPGLRGREGLAAALGLTFTPARLPLSIW